MIVFLTGASGVGKTSIVKKLKQDFSNTKFEFHHFDSVGVPTEEERNSIKNWQEKTTHNWIKKLIDHSDKEVAILEGSSNIEFILGGFKKHNYSNFLVILIDCDEDIMINRLVHIRNQTELANEDMKNWLKYLRNQAIQLSIDILDTSKLDIDSTIKTLLAKIEKVRNERYLRAKKPKLDAD